MWNYLCLIMVYGYWYWNILFILDMWCIIRDNVLMVIYVDKIDVDKIDDDMECVIYDWVIRK